VAERTARLMEDKANAWVEARDRGESYEKFDRGWRQQMSKQNVFGDIAAQVKAGTVTGPKDATPQGSQGVRRFNPATGKIE